MGYSKTQANSVKEPVQVGESQTSPLMSSASTYLMELAGPTDKFTVQSSGTLAFTYAVSANGINFGSPVSVAANALSTYGTTSADVIGAVQLVWVSGSGRVSLLSK